MDRAGAARASLTLVREHPFSEALPQRSRHADFRITFTGSVLYARQQSIGRFLLFGRVAEFYKLHKLLGSALRKCSEHGYETYCFSAGCPLGASQCQRSNVAACEPLLSIWRTGHLACGTAPSRKLRECEPAYSKSSARRRPEPAPANLEKLRAPETVFTKCNKSV